MPRSEAKTEKALDNASHSTDTTPQSSSQMNDSWFLQGSWQKMKHGNQLQPAVVSEHASIAVVVTQQPAKQAK